MKTRGSIFQALAAGALLFLAQGAQASLVFDKDVDVLGQGFGTTVNILTFAASEQTPNDGGDDIRGGVRWDGSADEVFGENPGGVVATTDNKTATHTFGSLGILFANQIVVTWNPAEQGNSPQTVVTLAVLNIYDAAGNLQWSSGGSETTDAGFTVETFPDVINPGTGGSGFSFVLDGAQAAALQAVLNGAGDFSLWRIGMYAEHDDLDDGNDTWTLAARVAQVPEPGPLALMAIGLLGLGFATRRRKA